MTKGDMNNYERKQLEFETEQLWNYITMPEVLAYN